MKDGQVREHWCFEGKLWIIALGVVKGRRVVRHFDGVFLTSIEDVRNSERGPYGISQELYQIEGGYLVAQEKWSRWGVEYHCHTVETVSKEDLSFGGRFAELGEQAYNEGLL